MVQVVGLGFMVQVVGIRVHGSGGGIGVCSVQVVVLGFMVQVVGLGFIVCRCWD